MQLNIHIVVEFMQGRLHASHFIFAKGGSYFHFIQLIYTVEGRLQCFNCVEWFKASSKKTLLLTQSLIKHD